ncbi:hypothetical protein [uncultured Chryseobacterium sp.]|uniref:hypothetical protein n=1 Tax=uncultured Chryseobacterium sp. TaxID=259322 RepID=UPI0025D3A736|nr:hypothetical protein [uncultured Chryseobacterium sp.]
MEKEMVTYYKELEEFADAMSSFPASSFNSTFEYDTGKLIKILQKKEVFEICNTDEEQFDSIDRTDRELGKIVSDLLKETDLDQSLKEYLDIEKKIENSFSGNLYMYAKQGALSVKSLYYYKIKDFPKAANFTLECLVLNDYLVQQGIYTLNLRCFEQNKNISRIYFRNHQEDSGYQLIFNLINYLLNGVNENLFGNIFSQKEYWMKVPIIRETYAYELFTMITEDMIRFNIHSTEFLPDDWYSGLDFEVNTPDRQIIYNWIYINKQLRDSNYKDYFKGLIYYFQQPYNQFYDILKIALLLDLYKFVEKNTPSYTTTVTLGIIDFMENKLYFNQSIRSFLIKNIFKA